MYHDDGLEVWIESLSSTGEDARYEELQLQPKDNYGGHYLQCLVPVKAQQCRVMFKVLPQFGMHGASALHVGLAHPGTKLDRIVYWLKHAKGVPGTHGFGICGPLQASPKECRPIDDPLGTVLYAYRPRIIQLAHF